MQDGKKNDNPDQLVRRRHLPPSFRAHWFDPSTVRALPETLGIALLGALAAAGVGMPAAALSGSVIATACAAFVGRPVALPLGLREAALVLLGAEIGAQVRPEAFANVAQFPIAVLGLAVALLSIMGSITLCLRHVFGFDEVTARLASVPGALPYVLATAEETKADQAKVAIVQLLRLMIIAAVMPLAVATFGGRPTASAPTVAQAEFGSLVALLATIAAAAAMTWLFYRFKLPVPALFGSLVGAALVTVTGLVSARFPPAFSAGIAVVIGALTGTAFVGRHWREVAQVLPAGLVALILGAVCALAVAAAVSGLTGRAVAELWLAFAPGGAETIGIIALTMGYDAAFVSVINVVRFLALGAIIPIWVRKFLAKPDQGH